MEVKQILIDFDRLLTECSAKKARENSEENWSRCTFDDFLEETVYFFSDVQTRLYVKLELEYGSIVPLIFLTTTKRKKEDEIRRYLQLISHAVWEEYERKEKEQWTM